MVGLEVQKISKQIKNNRMVGVIIFIVASTALLSWAWVSGIDYMNKNHPDYKGEDLFGDDDVDRKSVV